MTDSMSCFILFLCSILFGTTMGAYYCTMEYRIRTALPLITANCICPACAHKLSLLHQIPILSYFLLKGKCHFCQAPIPVRYPLTETAFLIYYGLTFCIFHKFPLLYIALWYSFVAFLLLYRCIYGNRHYRSLVRGLLIMAAYHFVIGLLYVILYAAI